MSISKSLVLAVKLQARIEDLRGQLTTLLDKARSEIASSTVEDLPAAARKGRPKMLRIARGKVSTSPAVEKGKKTGGHTKAARASKRAERSPLAGHKRASSPSGPLSPAVVKVLQAKNQPMSVRDVLDGLLANGYKFNSSEPKKNLAARIYRLKGVKQVSAGLFGLA